MITDFIDFLEHIMAHNAAMFDPLFAWVIGYSLGCGESTKIRHPGGAFEPGSILSLSYPLTLIERQRPGHVGREMLETSPQLEDYLVDTRG